jgi:hypothetical protein
VKFRLKAFAWHVVGSASLMTLVLGALYLGWYRWPGWYLAGAGKVALMMAGLDVVLGPLLTLVIANPDKPRRVLARDIGVIAFVQILAAGYGTSTLWDGRVLYYAYSEGYLQIVQANDLGAAEIAEGQKLNPSLAPHWYSLPRWIYAPLPSDSKLQEQIMRNAISGSDDVIQLPRYYQPWDAGLADLRSRLRVVGKMREYGGKDLETLAALMKARGLDPAKPIAMPMMGKSKPLLAIVDPATGQIQTLIRVD